MGANNVFVMKISKFVHMIAFMDLLRFGSSVIKTLLYLYCSGSAWQIYRATLAHFDAKSAPEQELERLLGRPAIMRVLAVI